MIIHVLTPMAVFVLFNFGLVSSVPCQEIGLVRSPSLKRSISK